MNQFNHLNAGKSIDDDDEKTGSCRRRRLISLFIK